MNVYGYHRTSTVEQHLDRGVNAIKEYCNRNNVSLTEMFTDQQTGKNFDRPDYKTMKRIAKRGDTIIVSEIDRLGRNKEETLKELQHYKDDGVRVMILEIPTTLIDYSSSGNDDMATMIMQTINNMLIEVYATFAHAEMQKREKRQREGIETMKERGDWDKYGRPRALSFKTFEKAYKRVLSGDLKPFDCIRELGIEKPTYYRYAKEYKHKHALDAEAAS